MAMDIASCKGTWCVAETRHGKAAPSVFELITAGQKAASALEEELAVVLIGKDVAGQAADMFARGAAKVIVIEHASLENFTDEAWCGALEQAVEAHKPARLLFSSTAFGRSLASRLAARLKTGLMADAVEIEADASSKGLTVTRPCYGGNLLMKVTCEKARPEIVTVRPLAFPKAEAQEGNSGETVKVAVDASKWKDRTKFVRFEADSSGVKDMGTAEIIVSGGRGVGGADGFKPVESLAKAMGGAVGASRAAVDAGWIPYKHQVGLTGRTVRPRLYVAAGISGQIQHLAGMSSSDVIVAINKDPQAPLMKLANFAVPGDLFEIVPAIIKELEKRRGG